VLKPLQSAPLDERTTFLLQRRSLSAVLPRSGNGRSTHLRSLSLASLAPSNLSMPKSGSNKVNSAMQPGAVPTWKGQQYVGTNRTSKVRPEILVGWSTQIELWSLAG
jgi:hypothetical protein